MGASSNGSGSAEVSAAAESKLTPGASAMERRSDDGAIAAAGEPSVAWPGPWCTLSPMAPTIHDAARTLAAREESARAEAERRGAAIRALLPRVAARLREECGALEVRLFGSLADGTLHARSDCDLAVTGVSGERFLTALGIVARELPCACDLVDLGRAEPGLRAHVLATGRLL